MSSDTTQARTAFEDALKQTIKEYDWCIIDESRVNEIKDEGNWQKIPDMQRVELWLDGELHTTVYTTHWSDSIMHAMKGVLDKHPDAYQDWYASSFTYTNQGVAQSLRGLRSGVEGLDVRYTWEKPFLKDWLA